MTMMTRLEDYLANAPMKTKFALAAAGTLMAALVAGSTMAPTPAHAGDMNSARTAPIIEQTIGGASSELGAQPDRPGASTVDPARTAPIVDKIKGHSSSQHIQDIIEVERFRDLPMISVDDIEKINKMNERTSDMLRDVNEIATRLYESKAWHGDTFSAERKAKNIGTALQLVQNRADNPDVGSLDGYAVKLRPESAANKRVNDVISDLNFKREVLRNAALEMNALILAVRDNRTDDIEKHRAMTKTLLGDVGYALNSNTDWSVEMGPKLQR